MASIVKKNDDEETKFEKEYSDESFWDKVKRYAKVAGKNVLEPALKLYYALQDRDMFAWTVKLT